MWHVRERGEVHKGFWCGDLREKDLLEVQGVDGMIILHLIFKRSYGGVDWIDVAQGRDQLRAVVYSVMSLIVP